MTEGKASEGSEAEGGLRANGNSADIRCRTEEPLPRKDGDIFFALTGLENQDMHLKDAESGTEVRRRRKECFLWRIYDEESLRRRGR